jgi:spore maturation protein CgeB
MSPPLHIAFFGSSLLSAYWNGAATYYRGIIAALAKRGHFVTFYEPDALGRQQHRDLEAPDWARVVVYPASGTAAVERCLRDAADADVIVKASGVGVHDDFLEAGVLRVRRAASVVVFWDVDAPATIDRVRSDSNDPFARLIGRYDAVLTYGGGPPVVAAYRALGARNCIPIYNALDPTTHHPVPEREEYVADLAFLGNRLPDREERVEHYLLAPAARLRSRSFLLGGSGWEDKLVPPNVHVLGHVYTADHNALNSTPTAVLNISRESMAKFGFSPATRVFEAAGAGACVITDAWPGIDAFLAPGREVLVADTGDDVVRHVTALDRDRARAIGAAARKRVLADHTYDHRAGEVECVLHDLLGERRS